MGALVTLSVDGVRQGSKLFFFVQAIQSENRVVLVHLKEGRNCDECRPTAIKTGLSQLHLSFILLVHAIIIIKTKPNKKTPYKMQDMCYLLSELNAEYITLKTEISQ